MKAPPEYLRQHLLPILLSQAVGLACGIFGVKLASHLVDPADYGIYGIFVSLVSIGSGVIYVGLHKFVTRHWHDTGDRAALARQILAATMRRIPWLLAATTLATVFAPTANPLVFGSVLFASAYLLTLVALAQAALQADREHWRDLGMSVGLSTTRSFLPPLLYLTTGFGLRAMLLGFLGHALTGALLGSTLCRRWWRAGPVQTHQRIIAAAYTGPRFMVLAIAGWGLLGLNRWLVAWFFGKEIAGYFTLAGNIGVILPSMLGLVMLQYLQPGWFKTSCANLEERRTLLGRVDRATLVYGVLALGLVGALQVAMPYLVGPLVSERYAPAATFVLATGFSTASITLITFYHTMLLAANQEEACFRVDLSGIACLMAGSLGSAALGLNWFKAWLVVSPLVPAIMNRTLARRALLHSSALPVQA